MMDHRAVPRPTQVASRWVASRTFAYDQTPSARHLESRKREGGLRISVGIPALNQASTIGHACSAIRTELMASTELVDELVVLDAGSSDGTGLRARAAGARVVNVHEIMREVPRSPGKGDTLWRSLTALSGDIVVWVDTETRAFDTSVVTRLVAPLLLDQTIGFVKGFHERSPEIDVEIDGILYLAGGGRMTEILVRPLLNIFFPELGGFFQPLATSYAGRMRILRRIPFFSGQSVDVGLLIDLLDVVGLDGMAQAALGPRIEGNQPLDELGPHAHSIARTILTRAQARKRIRLSPNALAHPLVIPGGEGIDPVRIDEVERPPIELVPSYIAALRQGAARKSKSERQPRDPTRSLRSLRASSYHAYTDGRADSGRAVRSKGMSTADRTDRP